MIDFEGYYWLLKTIYPGDHEFSLDNFSSLPWFYVVNAVRNGLEARQNQLHELERPVALLSSLQANQSRDPKKQKKPYTYLDFSFYKPQGDGEKPQGRYGAAFIQLVKEGKMPSWALFCYKDLANSASDGYVPAVAAFIAEDAILLDPEVSTAGYTGLLIALESAGDQRRTFRSTNGGEVVLTVPYIETKAMAIEGAYLTR